jgi:hypothetical protein
MLRRVALVRTDVSEELSAFFIKVTKIGELRTTMATFLFSPIRPACSAHFILPDWVILIILGEDYKLCSSSLCNFLHPPITSSLIGPNILLSTLFSHIVSLYSVLNIRDQVTHPYRTRGKIIL